MGRVTNSVIREAARTSGVKLWEIAEQMGITDANFSRKLRRELSDDERNEVLRIIQDISAKKDEVDA